MNSLFSRNRHDPPSAGRVFAEFAFILALFFVAEGTPAPNVNEAHYLSRFKHYWDPAWCQGDLFLESPDAHLTIVVLFGWVTYFASLPMLAWAGRFAAWSLIAWAWQRLSWRVAPAPWCAVLTAGLWYVGMEQLHLAGEWVVGGVEAKAFAYGFVLLALRDYLDDRWNRVWVLLGIASALHALVGGWTVAVLLGVWAAYHRREAPLGSFLPGLIAGGAIALLGVAPPILMNWGAPDEVMAEANQIYVYTRLPHHLALQSMRDAWILNRATRHTAMLLVLAGTAWFVSRNSRSLGREDRDDAAVRLIRFAWGAATLMLVGFVIETALAQQPATAAKLLKYYWFRLTDVAAPLAVALVLGRVLWGSLRQQRRWAAGLLLVMIVAPVWHLSGVLSQRVAVPNPPADRKMANYEAWADACRWAKDHSPPGAKFLAPLQSHTFKWRTGRAEVVTWKDVPQDAPHLVAWRDAVQDIYYYPLSNGERRPVRALSHLGAARLRELGKKYGAQFVLTASAPRASLPAAYENAHYTIYDLRDHP